MRNYCCFPFINNGLKPRINKVKWLLLFSSILAQPLQTLAVTLDVQVSGESGGRVASVPGDTDCMPNCTIQVPAHSLVSLFALADKAYRFQGWDGACVNTLGPLCTLRPAENTGVSAHFVKIEAPEAKTKALLLLHDEGFKHTVWNEFVKQRFDNRCPVVYGGVVLGDDAFDPDNKVYCYRIAFGYYDMLVPNKVSQSLQKAGNNRQAKNNFSGKRLGYEIRAAVLGILNRHSNLSLTMVSQGRSALAAQSFLQSDTAERSDVVGLVALHHKDNAPEPAYRVVIHTERTTVLKLDAKPEQEGKISNALAQLTKSWWIDR